MTTLQENPPQKRHLHTLFLAILVVGVCAFLLGQQLFSTHNTNTDPTIPGHPLSNPQMHLHTIATGAPPGTLYLGTHYGLFTSSDGGLTWPQARGQLNTLMVTTIATDPQNPSWLALVGIPSVSGGAAAGAYFSSDGGTNWTLRNPPGLSRSAYLYTIQNEAGGNGHFYAFYLNAGWFETRDMGLHWQQLALHNLPAMQTPQLLSFAHAPQHLLMGGEQGLFASTDDGQTWHAFSPVQGYVMSLVASQSAPTTIFCATDQGLLRWQDGSTQVQQLSLPDKTSVSRLALNATSTILYALAGQNLLYSQDSGKHWIQHAHFSRSDLTALIIDSHHPEKLYASFFLPPQVIVSQDSGKTWHLLTGGSAH